MVVSSRVPIIRPRASLSERARIATIFVFDVAVATNATPYEAVPIAKSVENYPIPTVIR
jgi:hypothetical protein